MFLGGSKENIGKKWVDYDKNTVLTQLFPMHPFSTRWKHQKTLQVFWCFQSVEKGCIGNNWVKSIINRWHKSDRYVAEEIFKINTNDKNITETLSTKYL